MPKSPMRSKGLNGKRDHSASNTSANPAGAKSPKINCSEASSADPMMSGNLGGPLPDPAKGKKSFSTDKLEAEKSMSFPKPSEAMKTGRI